MWIVGRVGIVSVFGFLEVGTSVGHIDEQVVSVAQLVKRLKTCG